MQLFRGFPEKMLNKNIKKKLETLKYSTADDKCVDKVAFISGTTPRQEESLRVAKWGH